ncbi:PLP-dependent aminotransferase family protein [Nocardia asteroides]|uniref:aminotransferase-like domain-containing protein n=1 Tax=Nocardia asteroides TaxID=1824 RepID=UPI001E4F4040|nr:PLP-dependent aminotransferase family protein [Nocardia asteroides]UGT63685.1 PLP-dependent aminotransferase family protein [Nocardia asteroides]
MTSSAILSRSATYEPAGGFGPAVPLPPGAVRLVGGAPATEALPTAELAAAFSTALTGATALQYSVAPGIEPLREWIADHEGTTSDRVLVTNGALHGLSLLCAALLDPGDVVAVENPTFPVALRVLAQYGARVVGVPSSAAGLDLDALERRLRDGLRIKLLYLIPDFQNPTGATLAAADRARTVALAERYGFVVVSDNPYRSLRFAGAALPDLPPASDAVVRVNTFSKTLGPGLRSGWVVAPEWLLPVLTRLRANVDQHSSLLTQTALAGVLTEPGFFDDVLATGRELYRERSGALTAALRSRLGERVAFDEPEGGIFLWLRATQPGLDLVALRERARALGVEFALGRYFDPEGNGGHTDRIRLGFSNATGADIELGVERIAAAWTS